MALLDLSSLQTKPPNPYVGPRPFEESDSERFFGRDIEARDIVSGVIANPIFMLYAQSGAGKTSILNARVLPLLQEKGFDTLPPARVSGIDATAQYNGSNLHVFNVITQWAEAAKQQIRPDTSLQEFLLTYHPPKKDEDDETIPRVVSIDQFEELFTAYPHRWQDREDFFKQLAQVLDADPLLRVLLILREDYIAQLDPYTELFTDRLRPRSRLERLQREAALTSIVNPLKSTNRYFAQDVAEQLVDDLLQTRVELPDGSTTVVKGEFVEPVHLQVVCYRLWEGLPSDIVEISAEYLSSFGNVDDALTNFYFNCIKTAFQETGIPEIDLRQWVETNLITSAGTRGTVHASTKDRDEAFSRAISILENMHLIRSEIRAGARWYELTHDRLIKPILDTRTTQEYGQATARKRAAANRMEFRQQEAGYVFQRWRAAESVSLIGVGSVGKSNLLQHLCDPAIQEAYLGQEQAARFKAILIDPSMTVPQAGATSEAHLCWNGYELLLHRLFLTFYPFDMLKDDIGQQFYEAYQTFQDGTNPLYAQLGLRYFEFAVELLMKAGVKLAFVLDDFELLLRQMPIKFFVTLRGLRDRNKSHIFYLTYSRASLTELIDKFQIDLLEIEPFIELFTDNIFYVNTYSEQDARDMLHTLMSRTQQKYDEDILNFILWASGRFPGLIRAIFRGLDTVHDLNPTMVKTQRDELLRRLGLRTPVQAENRTIWASLNPYEQEVLQIVGGAGKTYQTNLQTEQAVSTLVQKRLLRVDKAEGKLYIDPPIFGLYIRHENQSEAVK